MSGTGIAPDQLPDEQAGLTQATLRGDGIYNMNGNGQTVTLVLKRRNGLAWFRAGNDGALADTLRIAGTSGSRFLTVAYFRSRGAPRRNVTSSVVTGRSRLTLESGSGQNDECRLTKSERGLRRRFQRTLATTALSQTLPSARDRSRVRVIAK